MRPLILDASGSPMPHVHILHNSAWPYLDCVYSVPIAVFPRLVFNARRSVI